MTYSHIRVIFLSHSHHQVKITYKITPQLIVAVVVLMTVIVFDVILLLIFT